MFEWISNLEENDRIAILSLVCGALAWLIQYVWTALKIPGPQPDWAAWKKKLFAFGLALIPGLITWQTTGSLPSGFLATAVTILGSQTSHSLLGGKTPSSSAPTSFTE